MAGIQIPKSVLTLGSAIKSGTVDATTQVVIGQASAKINKASAAVVRTYANRVRRIVEGPQTTESASITTPILPRKVYLQIASWVPDLVLYRDPTDKYIWGLLKSINVSENVQRADTDMQSMLILLDEITELTPGRIGNA